MEKKEQLLYTFELVKTVIPLDSDNARIFRRVVKAGDMFFENRFTPTKCKEVLHSIQNATHGVCYSCDVYPWVGCAANGFILALESELEGGCREYWTLGSKYTYYTGHFLDMTIKSCFAAVREIEMCSGLFKKFDYSRIKSKKERKRMDAEFKKVNEKYHMIP